MGNVCGLVWPENRFGRNVVRLTIDEYFKSSSPVLGLLPQIVGVAPEKAIKLTVSFDALLRLYALSRN